MICDDLERWGGSRVAERPRGRGFVVVQLPSHV